MEKLQFDNKNFVLYAPDSLKHVFKDLESTLKETLEFYKKLFDVSDFRKVEIHYFDNKESFRNYVYELRGEKESLPKYAVGTGADGMIIAYIDPSIKEGTPIFRKRKCLAAHELFHIMYHELIIFKTRQEHFTWFDEGCAQFFSGEKDYELNEGFSEWFNKVKSETKVIPELNNLTHGDSFKNDEYNGYDLSLLAIKNLYDRLGFEGIRRMILNSSSILRNGERIIDESFLFYGITLGNNNKIRK